MRITSRRLASWLNLLVILAMSNHLLSPVYLASASAAVGILTPEPQAVIQPSLSMLPASLPSSSTNDVEIDHVNDLNNGIIAESSGFLDQNDLIETNNVNVPILNLPGFAPSLNVNSTLLENCTPVTDTTYYLASYNDTTGIIENPENVLGEPDGLRARFITSPDTFKYFSFSPPYVLSGTIDINISSSFGSGVTAQEFYIHPELGRSVYDGGWQYVSVGFGPIVTGKIGSIRAGIKANVDANGEAWANLDYWSFTMLGQGCISDSEPDINHPDSDLSDNECPVCNTRDRSNKIAGPINTYSGNYGYETIDISIPTIGQPLKFERSYHSLTTLTGTVVYSQPLGYGWTHNYDINLTFENDSYGEADTVILKAPHGSRMRFTDNGDGAYTAFPGVWATLTQTVVASSTVYTVTAANQATFVFNDLGKITQQIDPQGNTLVFTRTNGITLTRVSEPVSNRYLDFGYDAQGRLTSIEDHTARQVTFGYDANGDLTTVVDTRGLTWTYNYSGTTHLLHEVIDPANKVLERTFYTLVGGKPKATLQQDGEGRTVAQIDYLAGGQRRIVEGGRVYTDTYDARNLLVSQTDALGRSQDYTLDGSFNRTGLVDIRNQPVTYTRTALGLTRAITNSLNQATHFEYDANNNLAVITETNGARTEYVHDGDNNLRQIVTVSGTIFYDYNDFGQVISVTNRRGQMTQYGYDAAGNLRVITDALQNTTEFTYDDLGRVETVTNARGMVTRYQYDAADNIRFITQNYQTGACPATECNLVTEYQYDPAGRLVWSIDPANHQTKREYDAAGRLERLIVNYQDGSYSNGDPDQDVITRYVYDSYGRLESVIETLAAGEERVTRIEYDSLSRIENVIFNYVPISNGPDKNLITHYEYDDDQVPTHITVTDPTGLVTRYEYDAVGRLEKRIDNYQTVSCPIEACNLTTHYEYDSVGNLNAVVDPRNIRTVYEYDPLHRLTGVIENFTGSGVYSGIPDQNIKTSYSYDPEGNLAQVTNLPTGRYTLFRYDASNRLDQMENALGHITDYDYDPVSNLIKITKPDTKVVNYQYDLVNRLTTIDYPAPEMDVTLGYDKVGNRTVMTDTTGATHYNYDDLDRLTSMTNGNNQTVGYGYDARGNQTRLTYPDNKTVTYDYDDVDRPTTISPSWDSGSYTYQYVNNRLITMTYPSELQASYSYDEANRLTGITYRQGDQTLSSYHYTLDQIGNIRAVTETQATVLLPGAYQESGGQVVMEAENGDRTNGVTHEWLLKTSQNGYTGTSYLQSSPDIDALYQTNELTGTSPAAEYWINFTTPGTYTIWLRSYPANSAGDSVYVGLGEQVVEVTGFAPGGWSWANTQITSSSPATLSVESSGVYTVSLWMREDGARIDRLLLTTDTLYLPTNFGPPETPRLTEQLTISATVTQTIVYTYDNLYRLTNANDSTGQFFDYTYDAAGNRKTQTTLAGTTVYTYNNANRLVQVDGQPYTWDNNGNLLSDTIRTFTYDSANRLTSVISGATTTSFEYNGADDRYSQTVNGVTTDYVLDPVGLAQALVASQGSQNNFYLPGLAEYDTAWSYYLPDHLGSIRQLVDPAGQVLVGQGYDPFGNPLTRIGSGQSIFGYTGEQTDPTGLVYLRARYYHPAIGQFMTPDPFPGFLMLPATLHPYSYVLNNPIRYTDPSGEIVPLILAGVAIGAGFNLGVQLYQNDGDFSQVNWKQVAISGAAGGLGAGLGVGIGAAFGATTASNAGLIISLNAVGSGIIGGGAKYVENLWEGACDPWEGVPEAAIVSGVTGFAGSALGEGIGAIGQGIKSTRGFNASTDFLDLPVGDKMWAYNLDRWMRATFYLNNPRGTSYPPTPITTIIGNMIAPGVSLSVSNSGPLVDLLK